MSVRKMKPTSPGMRTVMYDDFSDLEKRGGQKGLLKFRKQHSGRNNQGKITVRHKGGGVKRQIRLIDFKRDKFDIPAKVMTLEYDPNRGARIALLNYVDGEKRYIVAPVDLKRGDVIMSSKKVLEFNPGNAMPLEHIQAGVSVYNIEIYPGKGGKIARGAGNTLFVMGVEGKYAQVKMPSGEVRLLSKDCLATVGRASNPDRSLVTIGKAGRSRYLGRRPTVRGTAMNPVDHPHGGGEGNQPIGLKHPKTKWGKPALGVKTRKRKKQSNKYILKHRNKK